MHKNTDSRGDFIELSKSDVHGQISFFTAHPGITRGGHYHHTKTERFFVIQGRALFRFKNIITDEVHKIFVSEEESNIVVTVPGWAHDITNIGEDKLICVVWANEVFDKQNPDTFFSLLNGKNDN